MEKTMRRVRAALIDAYQAQRPLEDFFGGFSLPGSWSAFETRVDTNLRRYAANYCALGALVSTWTLLRTPRVLLCLAFTAAAWLFFAFGRRAPAPRLGGGGGGGGAAHVGVALAAGLLLTVALGGVRAVAWAAFLSFCTAAVHVALRSRGKGRAGDTVSGAMDSPPPGAAAAAAAGFGSGGAVLRARGAPAPPPTHYATPTFHRVAPVAGAPAAATVAGGTPLPDAATLPRPGGARRKVEKGSSAAPAEGQHPKPRCLFVKRAAPLDAARSSVAEPCPTSEVLWIGGVWE